MSDPLLDQRFYAHTSMGIGSAGAAIGQPAGQPFAVPPGPELAGGGTAQLTTPGQRPLFGQGALNFSIPVTTSPAAILQQQMFVEAIILAVPNGGNTVFFGYGSQISTSSGIPIIANVPVEIAVIAEREQWELQRALEWIAAAVSGVSIPPYRAPRPALDVSKYFLVSAAAQTVACMLFLPPEAQ